MADIFSPNTINYKPNKTFGKYQAKKNMLPRYNQTAAKKGLKENL